MATIAMIVIMIVGGTNSRKGPVFILDMAPNRALSPFSHLAKLGRTNGTNRSAARNHSNSIIQ
jgi:hypothetical protein